MTDEALYTKIATLPHPIKDELIDYMDFLLQKYIRKEKKVNRVAGCMKGTFIMSDDFNEPLDCFKEYMQS